VEVERAVVDVHRVGVDDRVGAVVDLLVVLIDRAERAACEEVRVELRFRTSTKVGLLGKLLRRAAGEVVADCGRGCRAEPGFSECRYELLAGVGLCPPSLKS
jgi:hypothetical protein